MRAYIDQIKCKIKNQIQNQLRKQKSNAFYRKTAVYSIITLLLFWQAAGGHMRLAWWTTVYPQSLYETGIAEQSDTDAAAEEDENSAQAEKDKSGAQAEKSENDVTADAAKADKKEAGKKADSAEEKQEESIQIKWKLAEWIERLFAR